MLIRNNAPVFGANASPYNKPGEWLINVTSRNLVSNDHYNGTVEQVQRQQLQNYVTNRQNLLDIGVTRVFTRRVSLSVGVPFVNSVWASRDPAYPFPQPRREVPQHGRGLGDISATSRAWIFDPQTHPDWNLSAGGGIKFPTGNSEYQDTFKGRVDGVEALRYVDQSVQPGDGGWGLIMEGQAFWHVKRTFLFASGSYLANPRDTNDTPSIIAILGLPTNTGQYAGLGVNSVPDQYLARIGGTVHVWKGFSASLAWRMEGMKRYDLFGASHGWRRPGTEMFIEPGFSYSQGPHTVSFNVPFGYYYNRRANPYTGNPGDATFPRQIFLTSYSFRMGTKRAPATDQPVAPPAPQVPDASPQSSSSSAAPAAKDVCSTD
ncbi:MAG TPA: hypothetical protein VF190_00310 [Rhodothermales bacterium]